MIRQGTSLQTIKMGKKITALSSCRHGNELEVFCDRREALSVSASLLLATVAMVQTPGVAYARAPGSKDMTEVIAQIQGAANDLKKLKNDWSQYAIIDAEGRAGSTDGARRILGGIAPQAGSAAIEAAKATPLYRIDVAFSAVRKEAIEGNSQWGEELDLGTFDELADRITFAIQKADGDFYGVLFASKGTKQISGIFSEAKVQVDQGISDFDEMLGLLKDAGAPGL